MKPMAILKNVDFGRHERAEFVKIVGLKSGTSKKTGLFKAISKAYSKKKGDPNSHTYACSVTQMDTKSNVVVSCSCPDFMYSYEVVLHNKGAADIKFSNGEQPVNPKKPGCCKHLVMTFKTLFEKGYLTADLKFKSP
jgi:hypothetical protein